MNRPVISSLSNPMVKRVRSLRQRKARLESGMFLVEGLHPVGEAMEAGWEIESILYAPEVLTSGFAQSMIAGHPSLLQPVSSQVMQSLADKENPQGILAVVHQRHPTLGELTEIHRLVVMVSPQDPGNVGTVLRTMDAVGADVLIVADGGVDPYHSTSVRASMGAIFWKPVIQVAFSESMSWLASHAIQRIGTSAHARTDYKNFQPTNPWTLVLGTEQKGLSPAQLEQCDATVSLPMRGRASSLNVAVAAGILLYEFSR